MATIKIYEESKLTLKVTVKRGKWKKNEASFVITKDEVDDPPSKASVSGTEAKTKITLAKVADDAEKYTLDYRVEADDETYDGTDTYDVYPKSFTVKFTAEVEGKSGPAGGVPFVVKQDNKSIGSFETKKDGTRKISLPNPGPAVVEVSAPYEVKEWTTGTEAKGRSREAKVENLFKAWFEHPRSEPTAPCKQSINLATTDQKGIDGRGRLVTCILMGKGDEWIDDDAKKTARPGSKIYLELKTVSNTARTEPLPTLIDVKGLKKKDGGKTLTAYVEVGTDFKARFTVDLGVAGGDKVTIKVGTSEKVSHDQLDFENWRMLYFECLTPKPGVVSDYTKWGDEPGLPDAMTTYMNTVLEKSKIAFDSKRDAFFEMADLPAAGVHNVFDGAYWKKDAGKKVVVITLDTATAMLKAKATNYGKKDTITMIWVDWLISGFKNWAESFDEVTSEIERTTTLHVFPKAPDAAGSWTLGSPTIKKIQWVVTQYKDGTWKDVAADTDPGGAFRTAQSIDDAADIEKHVEFIQSQKIKLKLPTTASKGPGKQLTVTGGKLMDKGKELRIMVLIEGLGAECGINGAALAGDIWMNTYCGGAVPVGMGRVVLHELAHNMGQGYGGKPGGPVFGRKKGIPGIAFGVRVPTGKIYEGKGHQGTHCADGVANKGAADYDNETGTCLMFGSDGMDSDGQREFCADCTKFITAEDVSDIRKAWK